MIVVVIMLFARWMIVAFGVIVLRCLCLAHTALEQGFKDYRFGGCAAIELDPDRAGQFGFGLQHTGKAAKEFAQRAGATLMADAFDLPVCMAEFLGDPDTCRMGQFPNAAERNDILIVVNAQFRGCVLQRRGDMDIDHTGALAQGSDQTRNTGIGRIRHLGKQHGYIKTELFDHLSNSCLNGLGAFRRSAWFFPTLRREPSLAGSCFMQDIGLVPVRISLIPAPLEMLTFRLAPTKARPVAGAVRRKGLPSGSSASSSVSPSTRKSASSRVPLSHA
jgi:hypothetical protein